MKKILEELYHIEPGLRDKENELAKVVAHMIAQKPEVDISENFKKVLGNRLASEIWSVSGEWKISTTNRWFRYFWYALGTSVLASFAVSFGFLSFLEELVETKHTRAPLSSNIALLSTESETGIDSLTSPRMMKESTEPAPTVSENISENLSQNTIQDKKNPESTSIPPASPPEPPSPKDTRMMKQAPDIAPSPATMGIMDTDTSNGSVPAPKKDSLVAYVGEELSTDRSMSAEASVSSDANISKMAAPTTLMAPATGSMSEDSSSDNSGTSTGDQTPIKSMPTFREIVKRAQILVNTLIEESERTNYVLKTPKVSYISNASDRNTTTEELTEVYIFPLERTDGQESKIREIQVTVP